MSWEVPTMQSQTSYFDKTLFLKTLRRFWPVWAVYALAWFLILPLPLLNTVRDGIQNSAPPYGLTDSEIILNSCPQIMPTLCFFFSLISVMLVFSWLYNMKSACFHAALPVRRESLLLSPLSAAFAGLSAVHLFTSLLALLITLSHGSPLPDCALVFFAVSSLETLAFLGFFSLCAVLTSNLTILPFAALILSFTAVVVEELCRYLIRFLSFGLGSGQSVLSALSPLWFFIVGGTDVVQLSHYDPVTDSTIIDGYAFSGWTAVIGYAFAGIALLCLALFLFRRRRMESAGDVVAFSFLRPVFRVLLSLAMALCGTAAVFSAVYDVGSVPGTFPRALLLIFVMSAFALIGWFAADMLIFRRLRVFSIHWRGAAAFCTLLAAMVLSCELDVTGAEKRVPDASGVQAVQIIANGQKVVLTERENIEDMLDVHRSIIRNKALHEDVSRYYGTYCLITYFADSELTEELFTREYRLRSSEEFADDPGSDIRRIQELFNTNEDIHFRKDIPFAVTADSVFHASISPSFLMEDQAVHSNVQITAEEAAELYNACILPDLEDGTLGQIWLVTDSAYEKTILNYSIDLEFLSFKPDGQYKYSYFGTVPTVYSHRTNAWLEVHGFPIETKAEARERVTADQASSNPY